MRLYRLVVWTGILFGLYWMFSNMPNIVDTISSFIYTKEQLSTMTANSDITFKSNTNNSTKSLMDVTPPKIKVQKSSASEISTTHKITINNATNDTIIDTKNNNQQISPMVHYIETNDPTDIHIKSTNSSNQKENALYSRARQAVNMGHFQDAIIFYQILLSEYPKITKAWGELGDVFHLSGDTKNAAMAYGNAVFLFRQQNNISMVNKLMKYIRNNAPKVAKKLEIIQ